MGNLFVDLDKMNLAVTNLNSCVEELLVEYGNAFNQYKGFLDKNNKGYFYDKITSDLDISFSNIKNSIDSLDGTMLTLQSVYNTYSSLNDVNKKNVDVL